MPSGTEGFQLRNCCRENPAGDASPSGMTGRGMPAVWVGNQNRCAVSTADPETLPTSIAYKPVGFRPGEFSSFRGWQYDIAMNLLRTVHTHAC